MIFYCNTIYLNVFAAVPGYQNELCGRLINSGYAIMGGFNGGNSTFSNENYLGEIIALRLYKESKEDLSTSLNRVIKILNEMGAKWFGITLNDMSQVQFVASNIEIPKESKAENEEPKSEAPVQDNS